MFGNKMMRRSSFSVKSLLLLFVLMLGTCCDSQVTREEANDPPDGDHGAFFALRSCHQLLHGNTGEFFSPDYLCSNPPLWCNWTIQVDPGKRVHLHLEDLTPDDACHLKQDQVHVDDPAGNVRGHNILHKCWREVKYTSSSNTLYVVLLIGGWPSLHYRGFYGRYQAFGPPVVYNPQEGIADRSRDSDPSLRLMGSVVNGEQLEVLQHPSPESSDHMFDYYDQPSAMMAELPLEPEEEEEAADTEVDDIHHPASNSHVYPFTAAPTVPASTPGTSQSDRGATETPSDPSVSDVDPPQELRDGPRATARPPTAIRRNVEEAPAHREDESGTQSLTEEERSADGGNRMEEPEPEGAEQTPLQPNMVELLSDHRGNFNMNNHSESPHVPGDHLFEVAVEMNFSQDLDESWENLSRSLMLSVKALIGEQLKALSIPLSMSSKRMKRLSVGALYILWLQIGQRPGGPQVHTAVRSALDGLIATDISIRGSHRKAVITSVSTADVNECGTQLVLCDVHADCVNWFGSYSCRCRPGFQDDSRLGPGGTVCVAVKTAGCSSGLSAETKGVYVLFFLLSSIILMLLVAAGVLYHRHHRGAFLVRCHSNFSISPPDQNNNNHHHHQDDGYSIPADPELPPPPPPARGFREGLPQVKERRPAVDLPLLRFSPLLPPDGYMEPQEGGKM